MIMLLVSLLLSILLEKVQKVIVLGSLLAPVPASAVVHDVT